MASLWPSLVAMRTLLLLRHAKSDYPADTVDHQRPLAPRGEREAGLAGEWLRSNAPTVDAVLCSTATRTRLTLERTGIDAPVRFVDRLYDSTPGIVLAEINDIGDEVSTLLVVGHEPVMSGLALGLAGDDSDPATVTEIESKYPTSAISRLEVSCSWRDLQLGGARLAEFHVPR
ncbi:putative phosphohistidine phosphatase, SixA [Mycolicibacterium neoaurum]|uniref:Phosphohistidine phosphatase, SixA n=2 Tax=Mycolicibacterium neoaurum TaxID=1795 RepID=A0AAV2WNR2_MYCNE|nr:histidine phosphatase family protein [Mycolicibacterium neoaurum]CDQ45889.1 putative phosphohistidine phosphatase, SixA [Mycolicibacterium neoaurum]